MGKGEIKAGKLHDGGTKMPRQAATHTKGCKKGASSSDLCLLLSHHCLCRGEGVLLARKFPAKHLTFLPSSLPPHHNPPPSHPLTMPHKVKAMCMTMASPKPQTPMGTLANRMIKKRPASWAKGALPMMPMIMFFQGWCCWLTGQSSQA